MRTEPQDLPDIKDRYIFRHQIFEHNCRVNHKVTKAFLTHRLHTHNFYEILFCRSKDICFLINDEIHPLQPDSLLIFNDVDVHGLIADESTLFERYVIEFDPLYVKDFCLEMDLLEYFELPKDQRVPLVNLTTEQSYIFLSLFNRLENCSESDVYGMLAYKKIALLELILQVNTFFRNSATPVVNEKGKMLENVQSILSYIKDHLAEDLSLATLSKHFFMSSSYIASLFKNATGFTVNNYIINQRVLLATQLLKQNKSVEQVAEESGFNSYAHFIRTFSKFEGISPKQYAKRYQAECLQRTTK